MKTFKQLIKEATKPTSKNKIEVASNYEDGSGPVNVRIKDKHGTKYIKSAHWYNEMQEDYDDGPRTSMKEKQEYVSYLKSHHSLNDNHANAVASHMHKVIHTDTMQHVKDFDHIHDKLPSDKMGYMQKTYHTEK